MRAAGNLAGGSRAITWVVGLASAAIGLWAVMVVHAAGQSLLATVLLAIVALGVWTYGSSRTQALRYLFPAVAAALLFVAFPMLYTVGMGLTNQSSRNLLSEADARAQLLDERVADPSTQRPFELWLVEGRPDSAWVGVPDGAQGPAHWWSPPVARGQGARVQDEDRRRDGGSSGDAGVLALQSGSAPNGARPATITERVAWIDDLRRLGFRLPDGGGVLRTVSLREMAQAESLYEAVDGGAVRERSAGTVFAPDRQTGFFTSAQGVELQPGFQVFVGLRHYLRLFTEPRFREPFIGVFVWTVAFSGLTVLGAAALGLLLASLLNWESLRGRAVYRIVLFLPYAVPAFLSILVFKGLFNQNLGEINLILEGLFGIRPAWFSDPTLARLMLLIVNIWLGFPYMMVLCSGLIQSIPADLYEASAIAGASPWANFRRITLPLIAKPLTPLLISAFAFNFNNFVLISLLTGGRPDQLDSDVPAGTTDILVSYTWRIAFQDSGNQYGLAAAISTVIFLLVAAITVLQMRLTQVSDEGRK